VGDAEHTINHLLLTEEMGRHMDSRRAIYRFSSQIFAYGMQSDCVLAAVACWLLLRFV
jgi:hypothetical protein